MRSSEEDIGAVHERRRVGKIYTPIFSFFRKKVVNIAISNESPGNFTFYRGIHEFLNPSIFVKITVFFYFML